MKGWEKLKEIFGNYGIHLQDQDKQSIMVLFDEMYLKLNGDYLSDLMGDIYENAEVIFGGMINERTR